jgi:hypothetical protein
MNPAHASSPGARQTGGGVDAAPADCSGWQPIETAPRDGTMILIAPHMLTCWWEFGDDEWLTTTIALNSADGTIANDGWQNAKMWFCVYASQYGVEPTHWHVLPEPPVSA